MMNRREFAKRLTAAGVILAVSPSLAFEPIRKPLTYNCLIMGMGNLTFGYEQPTLLVLSPGRFHELLDMVTVEQRFVETKHRKFISIMFNGADAAPHIECPEDVVWMINEKHPHDPHYSGTVRIS